MPHFDGSQWHTYAFEWTPEKVTFFVDGQITHSVNYPADEQQHDEINVWLSAISANWNDENPIPSKAEYDYFRYYAPVKH
ncbi:MAG: glycoside hydrolase family 16 protein [Opitutales bacterium]|nr:glycoside hydrolase family 16 protein [Opitutales bacterium]